MPSIAPTTTHRGMTGPTATTLVTTTAMAGVLLMAAITYAPTQASAQPQLGGGTTNCADYNAQRTECEADTSCFFFYKPKPSIDEDDSASLCISRCAGADNAADCAAISGGGMCTPTNDQNGFACLPNPCAQFKSYFECAQSEATTEGMCVFTKADSAVTPRTCVPVCGSMGRRNENPTDALACDTLSGEGDKMSHMCIYTVEDWGDMCVEIYTQEYFVTNDETPEANGQIATSCSEITSRERCDVYSVACVWLTVAIDESSAGVATCVERCLTPMCGYNTTATTSAATSGSSYPLCGWVATSNNNNNNDPICSYNSCAQYLTEVECSEDTSCFFAENGQCVMDCTKVIITEGVDNRAAICDGLLGGMCTSVLGENADGLLDRCANKFRSQSSAGSGGGGSGGSGGGTSWAFPSGMSFPNGGGSDYSGGGGNGGGMNSTCIMLGLFGGESMCESAGCFWLPDGTASSTSSSAAGGDDGGGGSSSGGFSPFPTPTEDASMCVENCPDFTNDPATCNGYSFCRFINKECTFVGLCGMYDNNEAACVSGGATTTGSSSSSSSSSSDVSIGCVYRSDGLCVMRCAIQTLQKYPETMCAPLMGARCELKTTSETYTPSPGAPTETATVTICAPKASGGDPIDATGECMFDYAAAPLCYQHVDRCHWGRMSDTNSACMPNCWQGGSNDASRCGAISLMCALHSTTGRCGFDFCSGNSGSFCTGGCKVVFPSASSSTSGASAFPSTFSSGSGMPSFEQPSCAINCTYFTVAECTTTVYGFCEVSVDGTKCVDATSSGASNSGSGGGNGGDGSSTTTTGPSGETPPPIYTTTTPPPAVVTTNSKTTTNNNAVTTTNSPSIITTTPPNGYTTAPPSSDNGYNSGSSGSSTDGGGNNNNNDTNTEDPSGGSASAADEESDDETTTYVIIGVIAAIVVLIAVVGGVVIFKKVAGRSAVMKSNDMNGGDDYVPLTELNTDAPNNRDEALV